MNEQEIFDKYIGSDVCWTSIESIVRDARIGMIPADQAIKVPPVDEWPEWAQFIEPFFVNPQKTEVQHRSLGVKYMFFRPTPAVPKWTPKVGDLVFANDIDESGYILVLKVHAVDKEGRAEMVGHYGSWWHLSHLKPFDESKLGITKWEDI